MENASLDYFLDDSEDSDGDDGDGGPETGGTDRDTGTGGTDADDPGPPTSRWTPAGLECPDCGEQSHRLWRDGGRMVCAGCKDWT